MQDRWQIELAALPIPWQVLGAAIERIEKRSPVLTVLVIGFRISATFAPYVGRATNFQRACFERRTPSLPFPLLIEEDLGSQPESPYS